MKRRNIVIPMFAALVILVGVGMITAPHIQGWMGDRRVAACAAEFRERWSTHVRSESGETQIPDAPGQTGAVVLPELREAMESFNRQIYQEGQKELLDAASYEAEVFDLSAYGIEDGVLGVISIPKIDLQMPLYLGAAAENLNRGFAQLSQTSAPIGGENTNCVVAGHRGWNNAEYFYRADELEPGDLVYLQNYWEVLTYQVVEIKTILPSDRDSILIQPGRDLLTLFTCTPYRVNSHRLLVICERMN